MPVTVRARCDHAGLPVTQGGRGSWHIARQVRRLRRGKFGALNGESMRFTRSVVFVALVALASGCTLLSNAGRSAEAPGAPQPFWCAPIGGTALSSGSCVRL